VHIDRNILNNIMDAGITGNSKGTCRIIDVAIFGYSFIIAVSVKGKNESINRKNIRYRITGNVLDCCRMKNLESSCC